MSSCKRDHMYDPQSLRFLLSDTLQKKSFYVFSLPNNCLCSKLVTAICVNYVLISLKNLYQRLIYHQVLKAFCMMSISSPPTDPQ